MKKLATRHTPVSTISQHDDPSPIDRSAVGIALGNAFTIALAVWQDWDLGPLLFIYWWQSVIIGAFNFLRMLMLKRFSTEGLTSNGNPVPETFGGKMSTSFFFLVHYGFFHLIYMVFISKHAGGFDAATWTWIIAGVVGFFVSHLFSFRYNVRRDLEGRPNLGTMMFLPYCRVVPMHLTIIFGAGLAKSRSTLLLFLVLKSAADHVMHKVEHRMMRKA